MGRRRLEEVDDQVGITQAQDFVWWADRERRIRSYEQRVADDLRRLGLARDSGTGCRGTTSCGGHVGGAAQARPA